MKTIENNWLALASQKIRWSEARQVEIARNISNSNTPGYEPRDTVSFQQYLSESMGERIPVRSEALNGGWGSSFDGNGVVLEEQTILASDTEGQHRLAVDLYRKAHDLLALAASRGR